MSPALTLTSQGTALDGAVEDLLRWISTSPARRSIEIFVPSSRAPQSRRLQLQLQSLGCTVKRRVSYPQL